jgi:hypothetical protein
MWELINNLIKSGFPLLGIIFYTMILVAIWRKDSDSDRRKWYWTGIVMGPPALAVLLFGLLQQYPPVSPIGSIAATILLILLFIVGIPIWLIGTR